MKRVLLLSLLTLAGGLGLWGLAVAQAQQGRQEKTPQAENAPGDPAARGAALFAEGCASCHGEDARGVDGRGPTLRGVGAASIDFYVSTGRMPLARPDIEPVRADPVYDRTQTDALIAYLTALDGSGPQIPRVDAARGDVQRGRRLFTDSCSGCHQVMGRGGIAPGLVAPPLTASTATQIGEAIRVGPYLMPRFSEDQLSDADVDAIAAYVSGVVQHPPDRGGWGIGNIGPIPEGARRPALGRWRAHPRRTGHRGAERRMRALWRALLAFALARGALRARHEPPEPDDDVDPSRYDLLSTPWAERTLAGLLAVAGLAFAAFAVLLARGADTQLLGLTAGLGLTCVAGGLVVAGLRVVPQETAVEERPVRGNAEVVEEDEGLVAAAADGVSRRRLIIAAAGVAGAGASAAAAMPLTAVGPSASVLGEAPWRAGTAIVDEEDRPVRADALLVGAFLTAFPKGADKRELGSPIVVLRIDPATLQLPPARRGWAPGGLMAFSKICTHAGCAVSLFRYPTFEETSSPPALVCPCHYSTFDVRRAAKVIEGPAGRALPQLPLRVTADGTLAAAGPLSGSVGPAWWGTER